ncbi:MAG: hypothetical protein E7L25_10125, partial [Varibaculum cambriense]|nr:hypothetical protein [Varibaculum cambriense]
TKPLQHLISQVLKGLSYISLILYFMGFIQIAEKTPPFRVEIPETSHTQQSHSMAHHQQNQHNRIATTNAHPTKTG